MPRGMRGGLVVLGLTLLGGPLAAQDLSGVWRDNNGRRYLFRQVGEEFCWSVEKVNVFCGTVIGSLIAGSWLDLPEGPYYGHGRMVMKIENPNRLTKAHETVSYGAWLWTREGSTVAVNPPPVPPPSPPPAAPPAPPSVPPPSVPGSRPPNLGEGGGATGGSRPATPDEEGGTIDWTYRSIDDYKGKVGKVIGFTCKPDPTPQLWRALYGVDHYTGDSVVCQAAMHAGRITSAGGRISVLIEPGRSSYEGKERNGVLSVPYDKAWDVTFSFPMETVTYDQGGRPPASQTVFTPVTTPPPVGATSPPVSGLTGAVPVTWQTVGTQLGLKAPGQSVAVLCPPGSPAGAQGTNLYTGESSVCTAAAHMGYLTPARGGIAIVEWRPAPNSFLGTQRNGIQTGGSGGLSGTAFTITGGAAPPPVVGSTGAGTGPVASSTGTPAPNPPAPGTRPPVTTTTGTPPGGTVTMPPATGGDNLPRTPKTWRLISMDLAGDMSKPPAGPGEGDLIFENVRYDATGGEFIARIVMPQTICPTGGANQVEAIHVQWKFDNDIRVLRPGATIPFHMGVRKVATSSRCPMAGLGRTEFVSIWSYGGNISPFPNPTDYWWYFSSAKGAPGRRFNYYLSDDPSTVSGSAELVLADFTPGATDGKKGWIGMIISTSGCCGVRGRHGIFYTYEYVP